jgi:hypothetical protein
MRTLMRVLLLTAVVALVFPFLAASLLVDQKGVPLRAQVVSKDEWITVHYSSWTRHLEVTLKYWPPDEYGGLAFLKANLGEDQFDRLRKGDIVELHYLLKANLPNWPGMATLRQMHLLPTARLATQTTWGAPKEALYQMGGTVLAVAIVAMALLLWRSMRLPFFSWALCLSLLGAIAWTAVASFPRPMPAPSKHVNTATATVKSVEYWKELFRTQHSRGNIRWMASQPIAVVGLEFTPQGRSEPVVAVDLIDTGSVSGMTQHSLVSVEYESDSPRIARIRGAQREFARKNLSGLIQQGAAIVLVTALLWGGALLVGRLFRKLVASRA